MNLINNIEKQNTWLDETDGDFETFLAQVTTQTNPRSVPLASQIEKEIPIYSGEEFEQHLTISPTEKPYLRNGQKSFSLERV